MGEEERVGGKVVCSTEESGSACREDRCSLRRRSEDDFVAELVDEVVRVRREQGLSQRGLASISGVKQSVIARMESGRTDPQLSTVMKLLFSMGKGLAVIPREHV